ncbi:unnamed protein product, partial [marine sediment metagenome]
MNIEDFPDPVKKDIEDSSLLVLEHINNDIIVIGGWAVRALIGDKHGRYTLDIDGVAENNKMEEIESKLLSVGMNVRRNKWGIQFYHDYDPRIKIPEDIKEEIEKVELRIEISGPLIKESQTYHYFEFSLTEYEHREISYHMRKNKVMVKVPPAEHMAAVKLGLPVDYKNNLDSQVLLDICDVDGVVEVIKGNDDWSEMVLRRMPKLIGRLSQKDRLEHILAMNAGINIKEHIKT